MVHPYKEILFSHKRNKDLIHAAVWMNLEIIMLSKRHQSQKTIMYDSTYMKCIGQANHTPSLPNLPNLPKKINDCLGLRVMEGGVVHCKRVQSFF